MIAKNIQNRYEVNYTQSRINWFYWTIGALFSITIPLIYFIISQGLFDTKNNKLVPVSTEIIEIKIKKYYDCHPKRGITYSFCIESKYKYSFNGVEYIGERVTFGDIAWRASNAKKIVNFIKERKLAYILPSHPEYSVLLRQQEVIESKPQDRAMVFFPLSLITTIIFFDFILFPTRKKQLNQKKSKFPVIKFIVASLINLNLLAIIIGFYVSMFSCFSLVTLFEVSPLTKIVLLFIVGNIVLKYAFSRTFGGIVLDLQLYKKIELHNKPVRFNWLRKIPKINIVNDSLLIIFYSIFLFIIQFIIKNRVDYF